MTDLKFKPSVLPVLVVSITMLLVLAGFLSALEVFRGFQGSSLKRPVVQPRAFITYSPLLSNATVPLLHEAADLLDSSPLYVPGHFNVAGFPARPPSDELNEIQQVLKEYPAEILLDKTSLTGLKTKSSLKQWPNLETIQSLSDPSLGFRGFGQSPPRSKSLQLSRGCHVELVHLESGHRWERTPEIALEFEKEGYLWEPLVFFASVSSIKMDGVPFSANTTGLDKLDKILRDLVRDLIPGLHLPEGHYRIVVGP